MTTLLIYHRVEDYDAWRSVFDQVVASPAYHVVRSHRVWRGQDDRNLVVVCENFETREAAEAAACDPAALEAMTQAGVDTSSLRVEYLDDVTSG